MYLSVEAGDTIPADGEIINGLASIDESAITEKVPVIREAGGDKSSVTGGKKSFRIASKCLSHNNREKVSWTK